MKQNLRLEDLFRLLVVGVMFGCIALSLVELVRLFFPTWNAIYLIVGCVLAALEADYSYRLIRARSLRGEDLLRFRVVELALFFILLKVGSYIGDRWADVLADIQALWRYPYRVVDFETIAAFVLVFFSWHVSTQTVGDLERLGDPPHYYRREIHPRERLANRFFSGGVVLLIAAGLTRIGIASLLNLRRPSVPGLILNVLVYFLLGLVMLGQVRFATLRRRWQAQETKIADDLAGRWIRYSLAFIGLAAFLAFLLPTGYTMGLLDVVGWLLGMIIGILSFIAVLILLLITLPLAWLMSLLGFESSPSRPPPLTPEFDQPPQTAGAAPAWFQILRSLVFWAVALGIIFYVVRSYLRDHPGLREALTTFGPIRALRRLWGALWRWLGGWVRAASQHIPRRLPLRLGRRKSLREEPFRFFRLGALSPRERVLYYYLSILRRADQQGLPRRPTQTPHEYYVSLEPSLPQAQQEMDVLTQAFVEARYSRHVVEPDWARRVQANWQRVKAALQAIKRKQDEEE
jgi:hypothetical protein